MPRTKSRLEILPGKASSAKLLFCAQSNGKLCTTACTVVFCFVLLFPTVTTIENVLTPQGTPPF